MLPLLAEIPWALIGVKVLGAAGVAAFVTVIAYIHDPRLKMLVFSMPVPFTCAYLATGVTLDSTAITGVVLVSLYHWIVYLVVIAWALPLAVGIATSVSLYIFIAWLIKDTVKGLPVLWVSVAVFALWALASWAYRPVVEDGHRSRSPWYVKLPLVFAISLCIYSVTSLLAGAVATFPYAGVFTSYEMRRSLRTLAGQYTINNLSFLAMFWAIMAAQHLNWPRPIPLICGWLAIILVIWMVYYLGWGKPRPLPQPGPGSP